VEDSQTAKRDPERDIWHFTGNHLIQFFIVLEGITKWEKEKRAKQKKKKKKKIDEFG